MQNSSCKLPSGMTFPDITNWYTPKKLQRTSGFDSLTSPISPPPPAFFPLFPTMFLSTGEFSACNHRGALPHKHIHLAHLFHCCVLGTSQRYSCPWRTLEATKHSKHPTKNPKIAVIYGIKSRKKYVKLDMSTFTTINYYKSIFFLFET